MLGELQAALTALRQQLGPGRSRAGGSAGANPEVLSGMVVTGTGFFGEDRSAMRELAGLAGFTYSGDLVKGYTTHLVIAPNSSSYTDGHSSKLTKAAEWGIPCLSLSWLLDSIAAGQLQPSQAYATRSAKPAAASTEQLKPGPASCRQLRPWNRPSSVGSNAPAGLYAQPKGGEADEHCSSREELATQQQQQQPVCSAIAGVPPAFGPKAELDQPLVSQLRRLSIKSEPAAAFGTMLAQRCMDAHGADDQQLPPCSPVHSLSFRGLVGAEAQAASPARPPTSSECPEDSEGSFGSKQCAAQQPVPFSPMAASSSPVGGSEPSSATLAVDMQGCSTGAADELLGSMAMGSPHSLAVSAAAAPAVRSRLGSPAASYNQGQCAGLAGHDSPAPVCSMPTPKCMMDWSDDCSEFNADEADLQGAGNSPADLGITQTPPAIRQLLVGGLSPVQTALPTQQHKQVSQQPQSQLQQATDAQHPLSAAPSPSCSGAAAPNVELPAENDLVVSDSEVGSMAAHNGELVQHTAQRQQQQGSSSLGFQQQQRQQASGLLLVSRRVAPGQQTSQQNRQAEGIGEARNLDPVPATLACEARELPTSQGMPNLGGCHAQHRGLRDWSDDDSSSGEDFQSPKGCQRRKGMTGLTQLDPSSIIVARPKPSTSSVTLRGGGAHGPGSVTAIKLLQRPSRGNTVREHHGLRNLKLVQFAEQVQVMVAGGLLLSTKDKKMAVRLQPGGAKPEDAEDGGNIHVSCSRHRSSTSSSDASRAVPAAHQIDEPVLAEPQAFYRLPDGTWWLEYCRFYTAAEAETEAAEAGHSLVLPQGFDRDCELLKALARLHAPMADIAEGQQVRRLKQGSTTLRFRGGVAGSTRSYFWRSALDTAAWRLVTNRPAADFLDTD